MVPVYARHNWVTQISQLNLCEIKILAQQGRAAVTNDMYVIFFSLYL